MEETSCSHNKRRSDPRNIKRLSGSLQCLAFPLPSFSLQYVRFRNKNFRVARRCRLDPSFPEFRESDASSLEIIKSPQSLEPPPRLTNGLEKDRRSEDTPHNGTLDASAGASQDIDNAIADIGGNSLELGNKLRTLPGVGYSKTPTPATRDWLRPTSRIPVEIFLKGNNHTDFSQPWRGQLEPSEDTEDPLKMKRRRQIWFKRFHRTLLKSPIVPLIFRLTIWCFSLTALALGGSIQHLSDKYQHPQGPSALMAIIVDAVALVYLIYITWDEYTAKPLGLRSPAAKARLILLDIFFIVFDSANLSIAFESLSTVSGACTLAEINQQISKKNNAICDRQIALACVLLVALLAWLITFSISVLRYDTPYSNKCAVLTVFLDNRLVERVAQ
uniref:Uncharacterized protein AfA5C11.14c n=1 Tax=Aspergillus fumigatus TaxID=746128 RepID=Q8TFX1_ASPFM|nr:hypothetical protein [Aspergillus fumigatus]